METNSTVVIPSNTFSPSLISAVLTNFVESAATIEDIANQNNISIPKVLECLREQMPFLRGMLSTLELRVRVIAARVEAVAIETLREVATFSRDSEARRKAASKLLSHFGKAPQRNPGARPGPRAPTHPHAPFEIDGAPVSSTQAERSQRTSDASPVSHAPAHSTARPTPNGQPCAFGATHAIQ